MSKLIELPLYEYDPARERIERRKSELAAHCSNAVREFRRQKQIDYLNEVYESGFAEGKKKGYRSGRRNINVAAFIAGAWIAAAIFWLVR